jgi:hypothetical protein
LDHCTTLGYGNPEDETKLRGIWLPSRAKEKKTINADGEKGDAENAESKNNGSQAC